VPPPSYNHNWTDLHYAASHGNVRRIHEIIHKNGTLNINKKDYYGKTPLYWASYKGHLECMEELIKFGASVNVKCRHGGTPLHAVVSLYPKCALLLIRNGADVNATDNWGVTPMYQAATCGQVNVIQYLIAAGAKFSFKNLKTGDIPKELLRNSDFCDKLVEESQSPSPLQQICR
ncbi:ANR10-like protein, partial [Mya arenaria]